MRIMLSFLKLVPHTILKGILFKAKKLSISYAKKLLSDYASKPRSLFASFGCLMTITFLKSGIWPSSNILGRAFLPMFALPFKSALIIVPLLERYNPRYPELPLPLAFGCFFLPKRQLLDHEYRKKCKQRGRPL